MAGTRSRTDIERRDHRDTARTADAPGQAGSDAVSEETRLGRAFLLLTMKERLVLIWKKAGFSDREIAKHLSRSASAVREVHRSGVSKIHRSRGVTSGTATSDDDLPLNCPMCGVRLAFIGRVNDCRVFKCVEHGAYRVAAR